MVGMKTYNHINPSQIRLDTLAVGSTSAGEQENLNKTVIWADYHCSRSTVSFSISEIHNIFPLNILATLPQACRFIQTFFLCFM